MHCNELIENLRCNIGKTVTIFTTSGGLSGGGFTGVLVDVSPNLVKIITQIGAAPACPIGSNCTGPVGNYGYGYGYSGYGSGYGCGNWLGAIAEIPVHSIASFTRNAI